MKIMKPIAMICAVSLLMLGYLASAFAAGTFPVSASGDTTGTTDHVNIAAAFADAQAAGDGSTVQLGAGTFYIRKPIQTANFVGTLQGAGKDITYIRNPIGRGIAAAEPPSLPPGEPLIFYQDSTWPEGMVQDITLKDFTVLIDELPIPWGTELFNGSEWIIIENQFSHLIDHRGRITGTGDASEVAHVNFTLDSVGMNGFGIADSGIQLGNTPDFTEIDPIEIIYKGEALTVRAVSRKYAPRLWVWQQLSGNLLVLNSSFKDLFWPGVELTHGTHPNFHAYFEKNTTNDSSLVIAWNPPWVSGPLTLVVSNNEINQKPHSDFAGIEAWGAGVDLLAEKNKIHGEDTVDWGPIFTNGLNNATISNNKITGRGPAAIYIGAPWWGLFDSGCTLIGNNMEGWDVQQWAFQPGIAPIWLQSNSSDCTVVGNGQNVANDGTNNTITGAKD